MQQVTRADIAVHREIAEGSRIASVRDFLADDRVVLKVAARPAVVRRHLGTKQTHVPTVSPVLAIDDALLLPAHEVRGDVFRDEATNGVAEDGMFLAVNPSMRQHSRLALWCRVAARKASVQRAARGPNAPDAVRDPCSRGGNRVNLSVGDHR